MSPISEVYRLSWLCMRTAKCFFSLYNRSAEKVSQVSQLHGPATPCEGGGLCSFGELQSNRPKFARWINASARCTTNIKPSSSMGVTTAPQGSTRTWRNISKRVSQGGACFASDRIRSRWRMWSGWCESFKLQPAQHSTHPQSMQNQSARRFEAADEAQP